MTILTELRNASLDDLAELLRDQHARKVDIVTPASRVRSEGGVLVVEGSDPEITDEGVTSADGRYLPTAVCDEGIAEKLAIPLAYVRRMRETRPDLYDANVNGWLHGTPAAYHPDRSGIGSDGAAVTPGAPADLRKFLLRTFRGGSDEPGVGVGVGRAFLSDSYRPLDNFDVVTAALDGVRQAGVAVELDGCDLSERRMQVRIVAPQVQALAPVLLDDYRSPFRDPALDAARRHGGGGWTLEAGRAAARAEGQGYAPGEEPVVFAGFVLTNSETGGGAFTIVPRLVVRVCKNGLTFSADALRAVHVGAKLDEGVIRWSADTHSKNLGLITAKARDAVATFLDVDYMTKALGRIEEQAGRTVERPVEAIQTLGTRLAFDQATIDGVLAHFTRGGQTTAGGVLNAVTSYAQTVPDPDKAFDLEAKAVRALELVAVG